VGPLLSQGVLHIYQVSFLEVGLVPLLNNNKDQATSP